MLRLIRDNCTKPTRKTPAVPSAAVKGRTQIEAILASIPFAAAREFCPGLMALPDIAGVPLAGPFAGLLQKAGAFPPCGLGALLIGEVGFEAAVLPGCLPGAVAGACIAA